jgi:hypothetical protein
LYFLFETEAKDLPHLLIKKKIIQLISGKSGENHHNSRMAHKDTPHTPLKRGSRRDSTSVIVITPPLEGNIFNPQTQSK